MSEIIIKNDKIRKRMIFMDEATLERRLHLNMTLIGGFMVGYGVINRHDILGSAQTGNMVSLAMDAVNGKKASFRKRPWVVGREPEILRRRLKLCFKFQPSIE